MKTHLEKVNDKVDEDQLQNVKDQKNQILLQLTIIGHLELHNRPLDLRNIQPAQSIPQMWKYERHILVPINSVSIIMQLHGLIFISIVGNYDKAYIIKETMNDICNQCDLNISINPEPMPKI